MYTWLSVKKVAKGKNYYFPIFWVMKAKKKFIKEKNETSKAIKNLHKQFTREREHGVACCGVDLWCLWGERWWWVDWNYRCERLIGHTSSRHIMQTLHKQLWTLFTRWRCTLNIMKALQCVQQWVARHDLLRKVFYGKIMKEHTHKQLAWDLSFSIFHRLAHKVEQYLREFRRFRLFVRVIKA